MTVVAYRPPFERAVRRLLHRMAALYAISRWPRGPYGLFRLVKVLFRAEQALQRHVFGFYRHHHGQYSRDVAQAVDALTRAGVVETLHDADVYVPSGRLEHRLSPSDLRLVADLTTKALPEWCAAFDAAHEAMGYEKTSGILAWIRSLPEYLAARGTVYFTTTLPESVEVPWLTEDSVEDVAEILHHRTRSYLDAGIARGLMVATGRAPFQESDWRAELGGDD